MSFLFKTLTEDFLAGHVKDFVALSRRNIINEYWSEEHFRSLLSKKWEFSFYVTGDGHLPLAFVIASEKKTSVHIHKFVVDKEFQRKGLGGKMLSYLLDKVDRPITLKVDKQNGSAINFYKNQGFSIFKEENEMYEMILKKERHG